MSITPIVKEVSHPTACCPEPELWSCYDSEATEIEVLDMLRALVVMLKPKVLIETGCYRGFGTVALAQGVAINGFGELYSTDVGKDMVGVTRARLAMFGREATVVHGTGLQLIATIPKIDFAFLDSGPDNVRCEELEAVLPRLSKSGVVAIHDTGLQHGLRWYLEKTLNFYNLLQFFMFDTPRGLTLVRKPWIESP